MMSRDLAETMIAYDEDEYDNFTPDICECCDAELTTDSEVESRLCISCDAADYEDSYIADIAGPIR